MLIGQKVGQTVTNIHVLRVVVSCSDAHTSVVDLKKKKKKWHIIVYTSYYSFKRENVTFNLVLNESMVRCCVSHYQVQVCWKKLR